MIPTVSIALQGGGSHGAFTAGVLKKFNESLKFKIEGISGTSSGAVNACLFSYGNAIHGDSANSIKPLENFWADLGLQFEQLFSSFDSLIPNPFVNQDNPLSLEYFLAMTKYFAPYQFNPEQMNPLKDLLNTHINFEKIKTQSKQKLFIAATNIRTNALKIFQNRELTVQHILASTCLPSTHHSVLINNEYYWDGAFSGNPVIYPLIFNCKSKDIIIVLIQPLDYKSVPKTAEDVRMRVSEIAFASTFRREMRAIAFSQDYVKNNLFQLGKLDRKIANIRFHVIHANDYIKQLNPKSRYNAEPQFLENLQQAGYECAQNWLNENSEHIGKRSTMDLTAMLD